MGFKFAKLCVLPVFLVLCASSAFPASSKVITRSNNDIYSYQGSNNGVYSYQEWKNLNSPEKENSNNYYIGIRGILNFINHGYYADGGVTESTVDFGQSLGTEMNFGIALEKNWWLELDLGHIGTYTDNENFSEVSGLEFRESADYFLVNGIYVASSGFYVGPGLGIIAHKTGLNAVGWQEEYSFSPIAQVMVGLEHKIAKDWVIDFGTRLSTFYGTDQEFTGLPNISIRTGFVWNFALIMGIKYKF